MEDRGFLENLIVETGAYLDLEEPVILTSGQLGIFYVSTQKLLGDPDVEKRLKEFASDPMKMVIYACERERRDSNFKKVIDILTARVEGLLGEYDHRKDIAISGGQRRDWLFSGPVARRLDADHLSLHKSGDEMTILRGGVNHRFAYEFPATSQKFTTEVADNPYDPGDAVPFDLDSEFPMGIVHVVDLLTEGSSCYRVENEVEKGWIPMLRGMGANKQIKGLASVVTRKQGGEENLSRQGITANSLVAIDEDFVKKHSTNPERAVAYIQNPTEWSRKYLEGHGALALLDTFDPARGQTERVKKFLRRYGSLLEVHGKMDKLRRIVYERFKYSINDLAEGGE